MVDMPSCHHLCLANQMNQIQVANTAMSSLPKFKEMEYIRSFKLREASQPFISMGYEFLYFFRKESTQKGHACHPLARIYNAHN